MKAKRKTQLTCLTNALMDIIIKVDYDDLEKLGLNPGSWESLKKINKKTLQQTLNKNKPLYCLAGSPANTAFNASKLGLKTTLIGSVGLDKEGVYYISELKKNKIHPYFRQKKTGTGTCYIFVTPEGERTNIPDIGLAGDFPDISILEGLKTEVFHSSGYELDSNPEKFEAIFDYIKESKATISFDLGHEKGIKQLKPYFQRTVSLTDILFATEEEASELTDLPPKKALKELSKHCKTVILKKGSKGSIARQGEKEYEIPIYKTNLINTCGAGDAYAAGFLFGHINKMSLEECARLGSYIASRVCATEKSNLLF